MQEGVFTERSLLQTELIKALLLVVNLLYLELVSASLSIYLYILLSFEYDFQFNSLFLDASLPILKASRTFEPIFS